MLHRLLLHVDRETLVEPAGLALVASDDINNAVSIVFTQIVQCSKITKICFLKIFFVTHPAASRRILRLKNPLQPSQLGTP